MSVTQQSWVVYFHIYSVLQSMHEKCKFWHNYCSFFRHLPFTIYKLLCLYKKMYKVQKLFKVTFDLAKFDVHWQQITLTCACTLCTLCMQIMQYIGLTDQCSHMHVPCACICKSFTKRSPPHNFLLIQNLMLPYQPQFVVAYIHIIHKQDNKNTNNKILEKKINNKTL